MRFDGRTWRKSHTVVTLPKYKDGVYVQFGKICKPEDKGAIHTGWTIIEDGIKRDIFAKKIEGTGYGLTNKMYGKTFVRDGEVRVKAYLALNGAVYTTSWVHEEKTIEYQMKKTMKEHRNG